MKIRMDGGLPYVTVTLRHREREISLPDVLIDTGSTGSVFSADWAAEIGLGPEPMEGTDFLLHTRAVVDLGQGELRF